MQNYVKIGGVDFYSFHNNVSIISVINSLSNSLTYRVTHKG